MRKNKVSPSSVIFHEFPRDLRQVLWNELEPCWDTDIIRFALTKVDKISPKFRYQLIRHYDTTVMLRWLLQHHNDLFLNDTIEFIISYGTDEMRDVLHEYCKLDILQLMEMTVNPIGYGYRAAFIWLFSKCGRVYYDVEVVAQGLRCWPGCLDEFGVTLEK